MTALDSQLIFASIPPFQVIMFTGLVNEISIPFNVSFANFCIEKAQSSTNL